MMRDRGVILVNVLVALALGTAIVVLMFTSQETLLDRSRRAANATQAEALALGAEASIVTALRRDKVTAPEADHYAEPWALAAQQQVQLSSGSFSVTVTDAQSRFNLNLLAATAVAPQLILQRLVAVLELPADTTDRIVTYMARNGPQRDLDRIADLPAATRRALAPHISFLPTPGVVNVNTAGPLVLAAVLGSPASTQILLKKRERIGFLTKEDITEAGIIALTGAGFTSDVFDVETRAEVDGTTLTLRSRIQRSDRGGRVTAVVISRGFGALSNNSGEAEQPPVLLQ